MTGVQTCALPILCSLCTNHISAIKIDLTPYYNDLEKEFEQMAKKYEAGTNNHIVSNMYRAYARVLKHKWNLGMNILKAYKEKDHQGLKDIQVSQIKPTIEALEDFRQWRFKEWRYCNKSLGFEVLDRRIGGGIQRLHTTSQEIQDYLNGEITKIEELEQERLDMTYHREEDMGGIIHFNQAQKIMTAAKMVW